MSQGPVEARKKKTPSSAADVAPLPGVNNTRSSNLSFFGLGRAIANRKYSIAAAVLITAGVFTGGGALVLGAVLAGGILLGPPAFRALGSLYSSRQERLARQAMNAEPKKESTRSEKMNKASKWGITTMLGVGLGIGAALAFGVLTGGTGFLVMGAIAGGVAGTVLAARAIQVSMAKRQERLSVEKMTASSGRTSTPGKEKSGVLSERADSPGQKQSRSAVMNKASKWGVTTMLGVGLGIGAALAFGVLTGGAGFLVMGAIAGGVAGTVLATRAIQVSLAKRQEHLADVKMAVLSESESSPEKGKNGARSPSQPVSEGQIQQNDRERQDRITEGKRFEMWINDNGLRTEYDAASSLLPRAAFERYAKGHMDDFQAHEGALAAKKDVKAAVDSDKLDMVQPRDLKGKSPAYIAGYEKAHGMEMLKAYKAKAETSENRAIAAEGRSSQSRVGPGGADAVLSAYQADSSTVSQSSAPSSKVAADTHQTSILSRPK